VEENHLLAPDLLLPSEQQTFAVYPRLADPYLPLVIRGTREDALSRVNIAIA
ncbi:jg25544, partial [Pararge aegeria aegeria]